MNDNSSKNKYLKNKMLFGFELRTLWGGTFALPLMRALNG